MYPSPKTGNTMEQDAGWRESGKPEFFRRKSWWRDETLNDWLAPRLGQSPDAAATGDARGTVSFRELCTQVEQVAAGLAELGVAHGDVVAVQLPNIREFVVAWL